APGRADQHQELPRRYLQRDVADRVHAAAEALAHPVQPDARRLRRPHVGHDHPFSAPAISPRRKNRPSSTYTTSVGREASSAAAIAWLNGMVCTLAMLFSPIVTGHPPCAVITNPNRKSFQAEVNCQMSETANAGGATGRATKKKVRSIPAPSTLDDSMTSSEMPAK